MLNTKIQHTEISKTVISDIQEKHQLDVAYLEKQIGDVSSDISSIYSDQERQDRQFTNLLTDQQATLNNLLNHVYSLASKGGMNNGS